jgi:hypothetical protein
MLGGDKVRRVLGDALVLALRVLFGPLHGLGLRNLAWHGYLTPETLGPNGEWPCLIALILERGGLPPALQLPLAVPLPVTISSFDVDLPSEATATALARASSFVAPYFEATFIAAIGLAKNTACGHGETWRAASLAIILIENGLRTQYCRNNSLAPGQSTQAQTETLHLTVETLLSAYVTGGAPNQLLSILSEGAIAALYDSFIFPEDGEFDALQRNMLVHGSIGTNDVSALATQRIARVLLGLAVIFSSREANDSNKAVLAYGQALQLYQSQRHPIVLIRKRLKSFCASPFIGSALPESFYCTTCSLPREYCSFGPSPAACIEAARRGSDHTFRGCAAHVQRLRQLVSAQVPEFVCIIKTRIEELTAKLSAALLSEQRRGDADIADLRLLGDEMASALILRSLIYSPPKPLPPPHPIEESPMWALLLDEALTGRSWAPPEEMSKLQALTDVLLLSERLIACAQHRSCEVEAEIELIGTLPSTRFDKIKVKCAKCSDAMSATLGTVAVVVLMVAEQTRSSGNALVVASHLFAVLGALVGKAEKGLWAEAVPIAAAFLGCSLDSFAMSKRDKNIYVFDFDIYFEHVLSGSTLSARVSNNPMAQNLCALEELADSTSEIAEAEAKGGTSKAKPAKLRKEKKRRG